MLALAEVVYTPDYICEKQFVGLKASYDRLWTGA